MGTPPTCDVYAGGLLSLFDLSLQGFPAPLSSTEGSPEVCPECLLMTPVQFRKTIGIVYTIL